MSFHEKSAWVMAAIMLVGGVFYFGTVSQMSAGLGVIAPPVMPLVVVYVIAIVIFSIIAQIAIALTRPSEATDKLDERDRIVSARAGSISGIVLGIGILAGLAGYLFTYDGNLLFHMAFGAMMIAQVAEYVARIIFYRTGV